MNKLTQKTYISVVVVHETVIAVKTAHLVVVVALVEVEMVIHRVITVSSPLELRYKQWKGMFYLTMCWPPCPQKFPWAAAAETKVATSSFIFFWLARFSSGEHRIGSAVLYALNSGNRSRSTTSSVIVITSSGLFKHTHSFHRVQIIERM